MYLFAPFFAGIAILCTLHIVHVKTMPTNNTSDENDKGDNSMAPTSRYWNKILNEDFNNENRISLQDLKKKHYHWIDITQLVKLSDFDAKDRLDSLENNIIDKKSDIEKDISNDFEDPSVQLGMTSANENSNEDDLVKLGESIANEMAAMNSKVDKTKIDIDNEMDSISKEETNMDKGRESISKDKHDNSNGENGKDEGVYEQYKNVDIEMNNSATDFGDEVNDVSNGLDDIDIGIIRMNMLMKMMKSDLNKPNVETNDKHSNELNGTSYNGKKQSMNSFYDTDDSPLEPESVFAAAMNKKEKRAKEEKRYLDHFPKDDTHQEDLELTTKTEAVNETVRDLLQQFQDVVKFRLAIMQVLMENAAARDYVKE